MKNAIDPSKTHTSTPGVLFPGLSVITLIPFKPSIRNNQGTDHPFHTKWRESLPFRNGSPPASFPFIPKVCADVTSLSRHVFRLERHNWDHWSLFVLIRLPGYASNTHESDECRRNACMVLCCVRYPSIGYFFHGKARMSTSKIRAHASPFVALTRIRI